MLNTIPWYNRSAVYDTGKYAGLKMIGCETEIKLQNISKQEFGCNRSGLGVPVVYTLQVQRG